MEAADTASVAPSLVPSNFGDDFLYPDPTPRDSSDYEQPRLSEYERVNDEIRSKQAQLQAMGIELQLEGNLKTRKDVEAQVKRVQADIKGNAMRSLMMGLSKNKTLRYTPLPTYKRTEENQRIQRDLNKELFGNPLDWRGQRPIVNRPGWNITRVNLGLGGIGV